MSCVHLPQPFYLHSGHNKASLGSETLLWGPLPFVCMGGVHKHPFTDTASASMLVMHTTPDLRFVFTLAQHLQQIYIYTGQQMISICKSVAKLAMDAVTNHLAMFLSASSPQRLLYQQLAQGLRADSCLHRPWVHPLTPGSGTRWQQVPSRSPRDSRHNQ